MGAKKILITLVVCLLGAGILRAQEPTTTWPYVYNNFQNCTINFKSGGTADYSANIHLGRSNLHYIKDDKIVEANMSDILLVVFGTQQYMNIGNQLMYVIEKCEKGFVARLQKPDYSRLNETGGAYGSSSNTISTKALTSLEGIGSITNHMMQQTDKEAGKVIPLSDEYFIVTNGNIYPAQRKLLEKLMPEKEDDLKVFVKKNKIKWSDPKSLIKLVDFLQN